jgi:hypothetical protein
MHKCRKNEEDNSQFGLLHICSVQHGEKPDYPEKQNPHHQCKHDNKQPPYPIQKHIKI